MNSSYGHTHQKAPDPVRSPKLSWGWRSQYCGGAPHGNTACCSFFIYFYFFRRKEEEEDGKIYNF